MALGQASQLREVRNVSGKLHWKLEGQRGQRVRLCQGSRRRSWCCTRTVKEGDTSLSPAGGAPSAVLGQLRKGTGLHHLQGHGRCSQCCVGS